jgi:glycosyltransferase involved in cell wall biosynthesis
MASNQGILVINYTAPEINHLAAELAETGLLKRYIRPYGNQGRNWERLLERMPGMGQAYRKTLGRRLMPQGFGPGQIREGATLADFANAVVGKLPGTISKDLANGLHWHMQRRIAAVGARDAEDASAVVASYVVADPAFAATQGTRILNYPIAHHRYIREFVAEEAELEPAFAPTLPDWSGVPGWVEPQLDRECERASYILVGSSFARDSFVAEGIPSGKLVVIPYGADTARFSPDDADTRSTVVEPDAPGLHILFVGQLSQRKGLSYLLRAYHAFRGPGTRLTLVGNYVGDPSALAPYREAFRHVPHVPQSELLHLYRRADVFVFPTLIEGMPLVVLEAMASGLPVITTSNGPGDIVRDGIDGFVVPIRDAETITEKLEYLRSHPEVRRAMGRNARERAFGFSWQEYRRKVLRFLIEMESEGKLPKADGDDIVGAKQ